MLSILIGFSKVNKYLNYEVWKQIEQDGCVGTIKVHFNLELFC